MSNKRELNPFPSSVAVILSLPSLVHPSPSVVCLPIIIRMILLSSDQSDSREVKSSDEEAEKKDEQEGRPRNKT